jgi:hypothetical protein
MIADYFVIIGFKKNVNRATTQVMMKTGMFARSWE